MKIREYLRNDVLILSENELSYYVDLLSESTYPMKCDPFLGKVKKALTYQYEDTKEMLMIYKEYMGGSYVSKRDIDKANFFLLEIFKLVGIGTTFALPAGSLLLPVLLKFANRCNVDILPNSLKIFLK